MHQLYANQTQMSIYISKLMFIHLQRAIWKYISTRVIVIVVVIFIIIADIEDIQPYLRGTVCQQQGYKKKLKKQHQLKRGEKYSCFG